MRKRKAKMPKATKGKASSKAMLAGPVKAPDMKGGFPIGKSVGSGAKGKSKGGYRQRMDKAEL